MIRAFVAATIVLALTQVDALEPHQIGRATPPANAFDFAEDVECDVCEAIVAAAMVAAKNKTTLDELTKILDEDCSKLFPTNNVTQAVCDLIGAGLVALLPFIDKQLTTLAWDIPLGFCSVFVPVCTQPCCNEPFVPEQVHLSFASSDLSTMLVAWTTLNSTETSTVQWGPAVNGSAPVFPFSATGSSRTSSQVRCDRARLQFYTTFNSLLRVSLLSSQGGWLGEIHQAVMVQLSSDTQYWYRVGDANGWSDVFNFTTLPSNIGTADRPLRIIQIADMYVRGYAFLYH